MKKLISAYEKSASDLKVMGASPHGIVKMLLEKMCEQLSLAGEALEELQSAEKGRVQITIRSANALQYAMRINQYLDGGLSKDHDAEFAGQLSDLYQHIQYQILSATQHQDPKYTEQGLKVAKDILEIWESIPSEFHYVANN